jgi:hypothetical protein
MSSSLSTTFTVTGNTVTFISAAEQNVATSAYLNCFLLTDTQLPNYAGFTVQANCPLCDLEGKSKVKQSHYRP